MINRSKLKAPSVCWILLFIISISTLNLRPIDAQSLDDLNIVTTILPDIIDTTNQVNKTSSSTTTIASIIDLNADASNHFTLDGHCRNDTHCEQPNQYCKLDNQTDQGKCECSNGFIGETCNQISDCSMCTNRSKCTNVNNTLSCTCKNGRLSRMDNIHSSFQFQSFKVN